MPENHSPDTTLQKALELSDIQERAAYLDEVCGEDRALRHEVESLLAAHLAAGGFMDTLADSNWEEALTEKPGDLIGRYKLLQEIGQGGGGVVYMADQTEPVKRRVALKVIKLGMDTRQVVARFEAERQALALMDHPNIAKVLDAGATESGRPYFVMELVKGVPITKFCDENKLSTKERLELFIQVCEAVQHAHQKGIIHRDLKPGNILVTIMEDRPVPKVIDFGIAKATQQELTEKTLFTQHGHIIGTPAYMSPEQASMTGYDIDTRSDVYAMGVVLYELLCGKTPFDTTELLKAGYDEIRRVIAEDEPSKPSTRLSTLGDGELTSLATHRHTEPRKLSRLVRGDLDWIVMKALEKDRRRRYETANGFAVDVRRFLDQEPVIAGPPGMGYKMGKFVRRNRATVAVVATITVLLVAGIFGTSWYAIRAAENLKISRRAEQKEREAKEKLQEARESEREAKRIAAKKLMRDVHYMATLKDQDLKGQIRKEGTKIPVGLFRRGRNIQFSYVQPKTKEPIRFHVRHGTGQLDLFEMVDGKTLRFSDEKLGQAIEGTDISYEDLTMSFLYWPEGIREGSAKIDGQDCWVIRAINPRKTGNYRQVRVWIHKKMNSLMQVVAYNSQGRPLKRMTVTNMTTVENVGFIGRALNNRRYYTFRQARFDSIDPVANKVVGITYLEFKRPKPDKPKPGARPEDGATP